MVSSGLTVPVEAIREAARNSVAASSLRAVSADTGVSYTALRGFLSGSEPYSENLHRLSEWYLRTIPGTATAAALSALLATLPASARDSAGAKIRAIIVEAFEAGGIILPDL